MWPTVLAVLMLVCSNLIMTYAWFGHLRDNPDTFWFKVVLFSWSLAFFEYTLMIPAVRMASKHITVTQLKIIQEAISLTVFIPFSVFFLKESFKTDYIWACLCILGAVFLIFREKITG